ncbi:hypothetical protein [Slackia heliotrinireducens]|uniref:hypothetical protein n=1 Tax=Slackia heliotrinireducens TaxID=84110 RepID=UPI003314AF62
MRKAQFITIAIAVALACALTVSCSGGETPSQATGEGASAVSSGAQPSADLDMASSRTQSDYRDISTYTIRIQDVPYTGEAQKPQVEVYVEGLAELVEGKDFMVGEYTDNVEPGMATVVIVAMSPYYGEVAGHFNITTSPDRPYPGAADGWVQDGDSYQFMNAAGQPLVNQWCDVDGKVYFLGSDGRMVTGWLDWMGGRYYLDESGVAVTGWEEIDDAWYYFDDAGAMATDRWVGDSYLTESGEMATDMWVGDSYVDEDGVWDRTKTKDDED